MKKISNGFTVIEILFVIVIFAFASGLFFIQKNELQNTADDNQRKAAINAIYYGLEEVYYQANKYYPQTINSDDLKSVDPALITDQNGNKIGTAGSLYSYSATNCTDNKCKSYILKATLIKEAEYVKNSRNN